jgi:dipeptidyl aminopeptidase/acylaminoacyl peptidase
MYLAYYPQSVKIIPSLGRIPLILDSLKDMEYHQWRPDGIRIGGVKAPYEKEYQFWTSSAEGNDLQKEFSSPIGLTLFRNFGWAWSPDGKYIARVHDFREGAGYQEIFIVNLETGEEKQITYAKSNIEALCWSHQNMIIFSATISGPLNLWMVPAEGGELVQLTSGDGPDGPPKISRDGRKIIYPKMKMVGQIMIVPVSGGEVKTVVTAEQTIWHPGASLSPDGKHIAVNVGDLRSGWAGSRRHLYIMDRDGSNSRRIIVGDWENLSGSWSPDGKWMLCASSQLSYSGNAPQDVYIINVPGNTQPKKIRRIENMGGLGWVDSVNFYIRTEKKFLIYSITDNKFAEDTVLYYPIKGRPEVLMRDIENIWWIIINVKRHKIIQPENARLSLSNLCWTIWDSNEPLRTISLIDGKVKVYPELIGPKKLGIYNLSANGKEIIYSTQEFNGQISIIEDPFLK